MLVSQKSSGSWLKTLIVIVLIAGALMWGFNYDWVKSLWGVRDAQLQGMNSANFGMMIAAEDRLVVVNVMLEDNQESEILGDVLEDLEEEDIYADQVIYAELDAVKEATLAKKQDIDLLDFEGQLNFYAGGRKLGSLKRKTDRKRVEEEIERYLRGLVKRVGKDWLPEVKGMSRLGDGKKILDVKPASSSQ